MTRLFKGRITSCRIKCFVALLRQEVTCKGQIDVTNTHIITSDVIQSAFGVLEGTELVARKHYSSIYDQWLPDLITSHHV